MTTPRQQYIVRLLQNLELSLSRGERREESEPVSMLLRSAQQSRDPESVLESASAIATFGDLPLRLLWYAERYGDMPSSAVDAKVVEYQVEMLAQSLRTGRPAPPPGTAAPPEATAAGDQPKGAAPEMPPAEAATPQAGPVEAVPQGPSEEPASPRPAGIQSTDQPVPPEPASALPGGAVAKHVSEADRSGEETPAEEQPGFELVPVPPDAGGTTGEARLSPTSPPLEAAVRAFSAAVAAITHESFAGERFRGVQESSIRALMRNVERLHDTAMVSGDTDVTRFSEASSGFLMYLLEHRLFNDVRVVNFLDNASLTLHTAIETRIADDVDSLQQMAELLSNPAALFDAASNTKG